MKKLTIDYSNYIIPDEVVAPLVPLLLQWKTTKGSSVSFAFSEAPDYAREILKEEVTKELSDTLIKDKETYLRWWAEEKEKVNALTKQVNILLGQTENA